MLSKEQKQGRHALNGTAGMCACRIKVINEERRLSLTVAEAQGRIDTQAKNDSITMWSKE